MFANRLDRIHETTEKATRNISVSLNVGVIIASVALLVATVALVVSVGRNQ